MSRNYCKFRGIGFHRHKRLLMHFCRPVGEFHAQLNGPSGLGERKSIAKRGSRDVGHKSLKLIDELAQTNANHGRERPT